ncbi:hypothetical protein I6A84_40500 [Frankia sp. CNm7]|uniref:Cucumopine synthase C-terminal helical bundle domain-containing protein n=1 Tax=Frankia nepalensis TaxID=1836974 RepID=A0A937RM05_9ACTN|nr:hypothetical protein [Frankia nepalensis]MBL7498860.1 hypothetical protein [Frankia nepalensis]MBL7513692.1 hypothetical protein [Frankia nepalensis]MBL7524157.1 hypothetical protein [Frankia nepalensis]MBL7631360.1 hypothetical protein [Frankia nepalensis]
MRQIEIEWRPAGIRVTADLDEERNPNLVDLLWSKLPYNSLQNHALVSGDHLYHLVPHPELIYTEPTMRVADRTKEPDGTIFLSQLQHVGIKYGPLSEYLPAAPVGRVRAEDIALLKEAGARCWESAYTSKEVVEVRVHRKDDPTPVGRLPRLPALSRAWLQELVEEIIGETERIWLYPPEELLDIHTGRIRSRAGSRDQYFSTQVFVNGETRPLGYCALNGLIRLGQRPDLTLQALQLITPNFVHTPAEFLGYCGLEKLRDYTERTLLAVRETRTKDEFIRVLWPLALYANCLNTWNLHLFP